MKRWKRPIKLYCLKRPDGLLDYGRLSADPCDLKKHISWDGTRPPGEKWVALVEQGWIIVPVSLAEGHRRFI